MGTEGVKGGGGRGEGGESVRGNEHTDKARHGDHRSRSQAEPGKKSRQNGVRGVYRAKALGHI